MNTGKCLLLYTHYKPLIGGAQTVYDALATHAGGRIEVLTASHDIHSGVEVPGWQAFDKAANYKIHRIAQLRPPPGVSWRQAPLTWLKLIVKQFFIRKHVLSAIKSLLKTGGFDCLCIGDMGQLGWIAERKKHLGDIRIVHYIHGEEVSQTAYSAAAERKRKRILQAADSIVAVSRFTKEILINRYRTEPEKTFVCENGVSLERYNGEALAVDNPFTESPIVFSCGRLVERKGFDTLIEVWPEVLKIVSGAHLYIAGDGPLKAQLEKRVRTLKLDGSVHFLGVLSDDIMPACYGAADVFAMPNRTLDDGDTEGFGLVFLEAAAMGTPSIGGQAGGVPEVVSHNKTGLLVDPENKAAVAGAIVKLLRDTQLRSEMGSAARAFALERGWDKKTRELLCILSGEKVGESE